MLQNVTGVAIGGRYEHSREKLKWLLQTVKVVAVGDVMNTAGKN